MTASAEKTDLGLYVHIPYCLRKCPYCAFYSEPLAQHDPRPVIDAILTELDLYAPADPVQTIYIGGGSPTCLPEEILCGLIERLTARTGTVAELTVECNPAQSNASLFRALRHCGVNRLSIGAQSFHTDELTMLGRPHSAEAIAQTVADARTAGINAIGLDLIFGVPCSTVETLAQSVQVAIDLAPSHISGYSLTWEDRTPLTQAMAAGHLQALDEDTERAMYRQLCRQLAAAGYAQYEISNFSRPGCECRHNLRYWHNRPVIGLGPSASSWYRGRRTANIADTERYLALLQSGQFAYDTYEQPAPLQIASETVILGLRLIEGVATADVYRASGYDGLTLFADTIAEHRQSGLLEQTSTHLRLTEQGRSFADTVACDFILP